VVAEPLLFKPRSITVEHERDWRNELRLELPRVRSEVLVTATATAVSTDEAARAIETLPERDLQSRNEYSLTDSIQVVSGVRVQSLGGPGSFVRV
jgi:outer membrane receptor for ferrienterochelin and colicin